MSSIINAGTSGVTITGSTTTTLSLATNGTTAMTIDAAQNVAFANPVTFSGNIDANGNLNFIGTGRRITGDFSNATVANRVLFQSSTTNGGTEVGVMPNGTGTSAGWNVYGTPTTAATTVARFDIANNTETRLLSGRTDASVSFIPLTFYTGGSERMRLDTSGNALLGTTTGLAGSRLTVVGGGTQLSPGTTAQEGVRIQRATGYATFTGINNDNNAYNGLQFFTGASAAATIDTSGNVGIGTASPGTRLTVSSATNAGISVTDGTVTTIMYNSTGGVGSIGTTSNHSVNLLTNNATRVTVTNGGHVSMTGRLGVNGASTDATFVLAVQAGRTSLAANSETYALGVRYASSTGIYYIGATNSATPDLVFSQVGGSERARLTNAGGFSVGTTADPGAGAIFATGNITAYYSDARLKDFKGKIGGALDKVSQLNGYYYTENAKAEEFGYNNKAMQVGVSAQEVKAVLPEVVSAAPFDLDEKGESKSGENYMTVNYEKLVPLLIEAIKELTAKVEALEGKR